MPEPAPFNSDFTDADPFFSADGSRLYFLSTRPGPGERDERELPDVWVAEFDGHCWRTSHNRLAVNQPDTGEGFMSLARDDSMVFASDRDRPEARHDIYCADWNGAGFEPPRRMALGIRTEGYTNPLIGPGGDFLVFESALYPGRGEDDLFIVFRSGEGWTEPVNLGPAVNGELSEGAPNLSPDGETLYFARMTREADGALTSNLYRVPFGPVLARAREIAAP
jgi:Tol biopolymer transport system component